MGLLRRKKDRSGSRMNAWSGLAADDLFAADSKGSDQWGPVPLSRDPEELAEQVARLREGLTANVRMLSAAANPEQWESDVRQGLARGAKRGAIAVGVLVVLGIVFALRRRRR